jgi:thiol-disulfide isomerase/thioredoxin
MAQCCAGNCSWDVAQAYRRTGLQGNWAMKRVTIGVLIPSIFGISLALADANPGPIDKPPMATGTVRPAIDFTTASGEHPSWDRLAGKVVVLDFWATWCAPCIQDFPKLSALKQHFAERNVVFYSITYEKPGAANEVLVKHPLSTTIGFDNDFRTYKSLNAWGIPVVYIFDKSGKLAADLHPDDLNAAVIDSVLSGKKPSFIEAKAWSDPAGAETYFRSLRDKQAH